MADQGSGWVGCMACLSIAWAALALLPFEAHAEGAFERGREAFERNEVEAAVAIWREALQAEPGDLRTREGLGAAYLRVGRYDEAVEVLEPAAASEGATVEVLRLLGEACLGAGQQRERAGESATEWYARSVEVLEAALARDGSNPSLLRTLGIAYFKAGDAVSAIAYLEALVERHADDWQVRYWLARACTAERWYETAFQHFEKAAQLNADEWTIRYWHGVAYFQQGYNRDADGQMDWRPFDEGRRHFYASRQRRADRANKLLNDGVRWLRYGKVNQAQRTLNAAIQADPDNWEGYFWMAKVDMRRKQYDDAIAWMEKARERTRAGIVDSYLGRLYVEQKEYRKAIPVLQRAREQHPLNWRHAHVLGVAFRRTGQQDRALRCFEQAVELRPAHAAPYYQLGRLLYGDGDDARAITSFQEAVARNPGHEMSHLYLGLASSRTGETETAIRHLEEAVRLRGDKAFSRFWLGVFLVKAGRPQDATEHLAKVAALEPERWRGHAWLGRALYETGQFTEAAEHLQRARQRRPADAATLRWLAGALARSGDPEQAAAVRRDVATLANTGPTDQDSRDPETTPR